MYISQPQFCVVLVGAYIISSVKDGFAWYDLWVIPLMIFLLIVVFKLNQK